MQAEEREEGGLEAGPFADRIQDLLLSARASGNTISERGGEMGTTTYGLVGPNSQATAQKHNRCPICLSVNTLTRCDTKGAD